MLGRVSKCNGGHARSRMAILVCIAMAAHLSCLVCSAQSYRILVPTRELGDSSGTDLLSSPPASPRQFLSFNEDDQYANLHSQDQVNRRSFAPCRNRPGGCTVLDRIQQLAATCSKLEFAPSSRKLICVPFARRQLVGAKQLPEQPPQRSRQPAQVEPLVGDIESGNLAPREAGEMEAVSPSINERYTQAFLDQLDWLTPIGSSISERSGRSLARNSSSLKGSSSSWLTGLSETNPELSQGEMKERCRKEMIDWLIGDEPTDCLIKMEKSFIGRVSRAPTGQQIGDSGGQRSSGQAHLSARNIGVPKRSLVGEGRQVNMATAKAFLRELRELDGSPESPFRGNRTGERLVLKLAPVDEQQPQQQQQLVTEPAPADETTTPTRPTPSSDRPRTPECRMQEYTFRALNRDRMGNQCSGYVKASICYGGCDTGEISDWLFPHKKSIHKVCQHGIRLRRKVILPDCNTALAQRELSVYHYVDAQSCVCEKCNKLTTTCMGSLTAPKL